MTPDDISLLQCIDCQGSLEIEDSVVDGSVLVNAILRCEKCHRKYPVIDHVALMFPRDDMFNYLKQWEKERIDELGYFSSIIGKSLSHEGQKQTVAVAENWEYQWGTVINIDSPLHVDDFSFSEEAQWAYIPIDRSIVEDSVVLLTCAGSGRELRHFSKLGPQKILVNEIGSEIYRLTELLPDALERIVLVRSDATHLPFRDGVADLAVCDHGLQHIFDHRAAFGELARTTRDDGTVSVCVYSHENNGIMTLVIEPLKPLLHLLPLKALRAFALFPAIAMFGLIHLFYLPMRAIAPIATSKLPLSELLKFWAPRPFHGIWCSCFDLMHAPISYHFRQNELTKLAEKHGTRVDKLIRTYGTLWSLVATKI